MENRIQIVYQKYIQNNRTKHTNENREITKNIERSIKQMQEMNVIYKNIKELKPYKKNAKKHPKEQIEQIANSIKEFGFTQPVIIDSCMQKPTLKKLLEGELCYEENRKKSNSIELCVCSKFDSCKHCVK